MVRVLLLNFKKHTWKILALILFILWLLCLFKPSEPANVNPPDDETPPPTCTWVLCETFSGGQDFMNPGESLIVNLPIKACNHDELKIELERWWTDSGMYGGCSFPCIKPVTWELFDSSRVRWIYKSDNDPVNTYGSPDSVVGANFNGTPWSFTVTNGCDCFINQDWEIKVYHCVIL